MNSSPNWPNPLIHSSSSHSHCWLSLLIPNIPHLAFNSCHPLPCTQPFLPHDAVSNTTPHFSCQCHTSPCNIMFYFSMQLDLCSIGIYTVLLCMHDMTLTWPLHQRRTPEEGPGKKRKCGLHSQVCFLNSFPQLWLPCWYSLPQPYLDCLRWEVLHSYYLCPPSPAVASKARTITYVTRYATPER